MTKRKCQPQKRYFDPGKEPMGPPPILGEGKAAKVAKETRQLRRARQREAEKKNGMRRLARSFIPRAGQVLRLPTPAFHLGRVANRRQTMNDWENERATVPPEDTVWVVFDLDGTLANVEHRVHLALEKKWVEFNAACVHDTARGAERQLATMWYLHSAFHRIAICTGRSELVRTVTEEWLVANGIPYDELMMRPHNDHRPDIVLKREMAFNVLQLGEGIAFVVEDRDKVVEMWRSIGLTCFQCQAGAY